MVSVPTMSENRDGWIESMITIGVGCTAAYAISKPTLISMMLRLRPFVGGDDIDVHLHADEGVGRPEIGAMQRDRLARIAGDCDANEVAGTDDAVGRIELDPTVARQIDLHPGMGRAAADMAIAIVGHEQIAGDEARGDAETPQCLDHEQRIVAAGAGSGLQRIERMLCALLVALAVNEGIADAMGHAAENFERRGRRVRIEELA